MNSKRTAIIILIAVIGIAGMSSTVSACDMSEFTAGNSPQESGGTNTTDTPANETTFPPENREVLVAGYDIVGNPPFAE